ncbi:hypothetical protein G1C98_0756 [Bifidobacterium sp. DSM 109960]|uniref:Uncharacterized protein n=1 Tax=Bifidobacterium erythrocebi TaxID=2675325 RepID=A0A7Y0ETA7_9BIFI|nr:hypothetical protein [Bifidobacterium sp. DSM 109960]NMM96020.1 hypothetical protein [Bifidobacterium sp. DSM 109960]
MKKPLSKSSITAIVLAILAIPLAFAKSAIASQFFCSILVDLSIVFALIGLITVFGTKKHGTRQLAVATAVLVAAVSIVLSMYVR